MFLAASSQSAPRPGPDASSLSPLGHGVRGVRMLLLPVPAVGPAVVSGSLFFAGGSGGRGEDELGVLAVGARATTGTPKIDFWRIRAPFLKPVDHCEPDSQQANRPAGANR